MHGQHNLKI